ncbi:hypothetical protein LB518_11575 [Mesorhizobium sp. BR1-1-16]|uniref:hypothetical protein n=1 Tax=Mesorhizobium sp. BR1-1-16 TaxID=2876653 RepID=UPI001CCFC9B9|nr:hypothetical protein [Mesorhizobium sp. BR1-1-16]MBZ9936937.1 hypothetical protein [Mesorhizobium sp. BR1-1-16]
MGSAFRDIELQLTEAALVAEQMTPDEISVLFADAARAIKELRTEVEDLRSQRGRVTDGPSDYLPSIGQR